ncbi:PREDICTED: uncharacterized protein LOC109229869 [Nicotiana attenuata]|uniref:uncharacterized protein LOC109229869 n=1 Tax=Nicotiana attenuata TaxID=49451 RepID=UPI000904D7FD|nr:PREDICTED: uncharacterized protein LOC109229869 [Nicotiana attenuata]
MQFGSLVKISRFSFGNVLNRSYRGSTGVNPNPTLLQEQMNIIQDPPEVIREQARVGALIDIWEIKPRDDLIKALITFWDPARNVFRFSDFEITPTLEEMAGYIEFGRDLRKQQLIFPRAPFRHSSGLEAHEKGLSNKQDKGRWQIHRQFAFIVAFLGIMVFPNEKGTVDIRMSGIAQILTTKEDHTLAPLVLADIYRALTLCKVGAQFFEGCNILLQMWLIEHLRHHPRFMSYGSSPNNFITSYEERVKDYNVPEGFEAWVSHLKALKESQIEWSIGWLPKTEAIYMTAAKGYLRLMGVKSIQPYAPQRVLRQLGRYQIVPEDEDLSTQVIELHPEAALPEALVQQDWNACRYLKNGTQVPDIAKGEIDSGYAIWFEKRSCVNNEPEPEPERPAKRPHVQAFDDIIQERLARGEKEKAYQAEIHALKEKLRNMEFNNDLQAQEAEGLKAQIRKMKLAIENSGRSRKDEKLIYSLTLKARDSEDDLQKPEVELANA